MSVRAWPGIALSALAGVGAACGAEPPPPPPAPDVGAPEPARPAEILRFEVSSATVAEGASVTVEWATEGADHFRLWAEPSGWFLEWDRDGALLGGLDAGLVAPPDAAAPELGASGRVATPPLSESTRLVFRAEGESRAQLADARVAVIPAVEPPRIDRFDAFPDRFDGAGAEVTLTWRASGALRLLMNDAPVPEFPGAEAMFWPIYVRGPTRFTLVAERDGQEARREVSVRRSGRELEPNDDRGTAGFFDRDGRATGTITPGDVDWYAIDVPAGAALHAEARGGASGCDLDSQLELWGPDPERPGQIRFLTLSDDPEPERRCARIDPASEPAAIELLGGTHYLSVRGFDAEAEGPYALEARVIEGGCGNGLVEVARGERCDDGGAADGDGCSRACDLEGAFSIAGPDAAETFWIPGASGSSGHVVTSVWVVASRGGVLSARATDAEGRCPAGARIELRAGERSGGADLALVEPSGGECGTLKARPLEPGAYVLRTHWGEPPRGPRQLDVRLRTRGCGDFLLDPGETCDDGNRAPNDGCSPSCALAPVATATSGAGPVLVDLPDSGIRLVRVEVERPGASLTASVSSGAAEDVQLGLFDDGYVELGWAPVGAPLSPGRTSFADDLPSGPVYVSLLRTGGSAGAVGLEVQEVGPQCPDGVVQRRAQEQCDDGSSAPGDGCSSACRFEQNGPAAILPSPMTIEVTGRVPARGAMYVEIRTSTATALEASVFFPERFRCEAPGPSQLVAKLADARGQALIEVGPSSSAACPRLSTRLGPGTYYLGVRTAGSVALDPVSFLFFGRAGRCGDSGLDFDEECDDGNSMPGDGCNPACRLETTPEREVEPNDALETATPILARAGAPAVVVAGAVEPWGRDLFVFEVGRWQEVRLEALTRGAHVQTSCFLDTRIRVLDADGRVLAENDDDPARRGTCSRVELAGWARLLEGRYYLEVSAGSTTTSVPIYLLEVSLR